MSLKIALQMDHPGSINPKKDSTFVLALEAQRRGYDLHYYAPESLKLHKRVLNAKCASVQFFRSSSKCYELNDFIETPLDEFDLILMRQDYNDPMEYNALCHLLDHTSTPVLNDPKGTRESPEKMLITHFPDLAPPTMISRNLDDIQEFQREYKDVIIKPLNGFGGMDIYHLKDGDDNIKAVHEMLCRLHTEPFIVQKFIPEIAIGDKRLIVVEGEPLGALLRVPPENSARANLAVGGKAALGEITDRDREICATVKDTLIERGLCFVGIDVIGDYVTEINPKSPTGLQQIYQLQGDALERPIWDAFEARITRAKSS